MHSHVHADLAKNWLLIYISALNNCCVKLPQPLHALHIELISDDKNIFSWLVDIGLWLRVVYMYGFIISCMLLADKALAVTYSL